MSDDFRNWEVYGDMNNTQLQAVNSRGEGARALTAGDMRAQVNLIQEVMESVMKEGTHFGKIPGCQEPSLWKPGAEKIMATFRLAADPEVEDLSTDDRVKYRVKVRLLANDGTFVGAGVGTCSSSEEKYKWRSSICDDEWEDVPDNRRRIKYVKKWGRQRGHFDIIKIKQVRTEPDDLDNTILKMAKKRGLVDAVLTCTAASDIFTQDIEDLPPEYQEAVQEARGQSASARPRPGKEAAEKAVSEGDDDRRQKVVADLEAKAEEGEPALLEAWRKMAEGDRKLVGAEFGRIKRKAAGG